MTFNSLAQGQEKQHTRSIQLVKVRQNATIQSLGFVYMGTHLHLNPVPSVTHVHKSNRFSFVSISQTNQLEMNTSQSDAEWE